MGPTGAPGGGRRLEAAAGGPPHCLAWLGRLSPGQARPTPTACSSLTSRSRRTTRSSRQRRGGKRAATTRPDGPPTADRAAPRDAARRARGASAAAARRLGPPVAAAWGCRGADGRPVAPSPAHRRRLASSLAGGVSHAHLPLQRQRQRPDLPRHPEGALEPGSHECGRPSRRAPARHHVSRANAPLTPPLQSAKCCCPSARC